MFSFSYKQTPETRVQAQAVFLGEAEERSSGVTKRHRAWKGRVTVGF